MARVFQEGGFRADVWPGDHIPPHVHISKDGRYMRIAIGEPGVVAPWVYDSGTIPERYHKEVLRLVGKHQAACLARWRSFHG